LVHRFRKGRAVVATLEDVHVASHGTGVSVVSFAGQHDLLTSGAVSDLFGSLLTSSDLVVADFSGAEFIDSSILHVVLKAHRLARENGKDFRVQVGTEAVVRRAFHISGLLEEVSWAASREEAVNGANGAD
jgi:anti-anti-sigma factor